MKIALYGNVCNNMFEMAKALRAFSQHDVHLYLPEKSDYNNLPENDEPELINNYPPWIHRSRDYNLEYAPCFWKNNIIKELNTYDLVVLSSLSVSLSPFLKNCRVFFFVTGADLTVLPFKEIHRTLFYSGKTHNIKPVIYQWLQRNGISMADKILMQPFFPFINAADKLKIQRSKIAESYFPIILDTEIFQFRQNGYGSLGRSVQKQLDNFSFKIFQPSRIVVSGHPHFIETGQCKQNDVLVKAFAGFIKKNSIKDAGLYLINKDQCINEGVAALKKLIEELGIGKSVIWLKPEKSSGFTRDELISIYSCSDMVADDFGAGWFGSVCLEGFSCSRPVLSYVDESAMGKIYAWHPFLSSNTQEGNVAFIKRCYFDKDFAATQGELGRKWVLEYHSQESAGKLYAREFEKLLSTCRSNG